MSEPMTETEARERLAFYATFSDAVDQIVNATDALAVLLDPETMLRAWEKAGRVTLTDEDDETTVWVRRIVPDECPDSPSGHQWIGGYCEWCARVEP